MDIHYGIGEKKKKKKKKKEIYNSLVGWVFWHNLCRLFNAKSLFMKIVLFKTIYLA